ncbi:MAG: substrate-binding domain-containing protein, partial [Ruminococcus sp.]|nr:substrate-binding domain-containing protein [Ruminococcus sp.]
MTGNKRVIGICIAKVQSVAATEYLSRLHRYAREHGYKLIIFNSPADFYNNDSSDIGAKSVFKLINYDIIDAIIIHADEFRSETVLKELISDISEHNVPTVLIKARDERCYCIINDYESSLKRMIEHVICDHGVTDTCFIAGRREEDEESKRRISCYKEVLEANGLPFSDELVEYGEYWDIPTFQAMKRIIDKRGEPPKAIFCAN